MQQVERKDGTIESANAQGKDLYRDTPVRFLGYANELGEACRPILPVSIVWGSYAVACLYILADTRDKAKRAYNNPQNQMTPIERKATAVERATDTILWQFFASLTIPSLIVNRTCKLASHVLNRAPSLSPSSRRWGSTLAGLLAIPFIVQPIDHGVHWAMDSSIRPWLGAQRDRYISSSAASPSSENVTAAGVTPALKQTQ
ncbi:Mitochondrial fission process protein 1 [Balamuthia mandrillaris]